MFASVPFFFSISFNRTRIWILYATYLISKSLYLLKALHTADGSFCLPLFHGWKIGTSVKGFSFSRWKRSTRAGCGNIHNGCGMITWKRLPIRSSHVSYGYLCSWSNQARDSEYQKCYQKTLRQTEHHHLILKHRIEREISGDVGLAAVNWVQDSRQIV